MPSLSKVHSTRWPGFDGEKRWRDNIVQTSYGEIIYTEISEMYHLNSPSQAMLPKNNTLPVAEGLGHTDEVEDGQMLNHFTEADSASMRTYWNYIQATSILSEQPLFFQRAADSIHIMVAT